MKKVSYKKPKSGYRVVDIERKVIDKYPLEAIILENTKHYLIIRQLNDSLELDEMNIIFTKDITSCNLSKRHGFYAKVLKKRYKKMPKTRFLEGVSKNGIGKILAKVGERHLLLAFHCEKKNKNSCIIGKIDQITKNEIQISPVDINGAWIKKKDIISINDITRIGFGGKYIDALLIGLGKAN